MKTVLEFLTLVGLLLLIAILVAFPVMWLWNWLMPVIFGLTKITFFQALGLFVLSNILFAPTNGKKD